jgi:hypothetical protein
MNEFVIAALVLNFVGLVILSYKTWQANKRIQQIDQEHRKLIADAGIALTETIKIAFDNIKQINQKHERLSAIVKDNKEKIQNIMVGSRPNPKMGRIDKIARFRAAVDATRKREELIDKAEEDDNE